MKCPSKVCIGNATLAMGQLQTLKIWIANIATKTKWSIKIIYAKSIPLIDDSHHHDIA